MDCALINLLDTVDYVGREMSNLGQFNNVKLEK